LREAVTALLAITRAGQVADLKSISRRAAKPIISRKKSASALFPTSACRFIVSSVIEGLRWLSLATQTYAKIFDGHP
jgi:hypothetical protein